MSLWDVATVVAGVAVTGALLVFFFGPKRSQRAELRGGAQDVEVIVRGGYSPEVIRARRGVPLRLVFDRRESGECTSRVVFPDFGVSAALPAFAQRRSSSFRRRPASSALRAG